MHKLTVLFLLVASFSFAKDSAPRFAEPEGNFRKVIDLIKANYYDPTLSDEDLYFFATQGIIQGLNKRRTPTSPEARILLPSQPASWETSREEIVGIGVQFSVEEKTKNLRIDHILPGGAAEKAGLEQGDLVTAVNQKPCRSLTLEQAVSEIRGKAGEFVQIDFRRNGVSHSKKLVRGKVSAPGFQLVSHVFESGVGYLRIDQFENDTPSRLHKMTEEFSNKKVDQLVLDLRNCSGGMTDKLVESAGFFLPAETPLFQVISRKGKELKSTPAHTKPSFSPRRVIVLSGKNTAAVCELFGSSFIKDKSSFVVGEQVSDLGSYLEAQEVLPNQFSVQFTTAQLKPLKGEFPIFKPQILVEDKGYHFHPESKSSDPHKDAVLETALKALKN